MTLHRVEYSDSDVYQELLGRRLDDRFRLMEILGKGAFGCVYRAERANAAQDVAVKVLNPRLARASWCIERFCREAASAARTKHVNTVKVLDFGHTTDGLFFIAMELLHGRSLTQFIREEFPLQLERVLSITRQVLRGLECIHTVGLIHGDIKSDNIVIATDQTGDRVTIVDFGLAHRAPSECPAPQKTTDIVAKANLYGTPGYIAPEVICGHTPTRISDIYAAGIVLYELLAGRKPFPGKTVREILQRQLSEPLALLAEGNGMMAVPAAVETVLRRAAATRPQERYRTASEFCRELESAQTGSRDTRCMTARPRRLSPATHRYSRWRLGVSAAPIGPWPMRTQRTV